MHLRSAGQRAGALALLTALVACHGGRDTTGEHSGTSDDGPRWSVIGDASDLPAAAILSIWGTSTDLFLVGADDGTGPVVLHWDGSAWARLQTGTTGDLWWVWSGGGDLVHMVGEGGRALTYSRSAGTFTEELATNAGYTLFGVWGTGDDDLFAAAADPNNGVDGQVLHYDGTAWSVATTAPPAADGVTKREPFKVWGTGDDDVFVVGTGALILHSDGATWTPTDAPVADETAALTTVSGTGPSDVWTVGGYGNATVAHWDGSAWTDFSPIPALGDPIVPGLNGVSASQELGTVTCGENGAVWWVDAAGTFTEDPRPHATTRDLHACWIDETGAVWAVGGDLTTLSEGVILRSEPGIPPYE